MCPCYSYIGTFTHLMRMALKGKSPTIVSYLKINIKMLIKTPCYHLIENCDEENQNCIMISDTNTNLAEISDTL